MASIIDNKLKDTIRLLRSIKDDIYDPKKDKDLFGKATSDFVRAVLKSRWNPEETKKSIIEVCKKSLRDPNTDFYKAVKKGGVDAINELKKVLVWITDETGIRLGNPQFVAPLIIDSIVEKPRKTFTKYEPIMEMVNADPVEDDELSLFDLGWDDIGAFGDVNKVLREIGRFLKDPKKVRLYLSTIEALKDDNTGGSEEEEKEESKRKMSILKSLVYRLLGHLRDEKLKAYLAALEKRRVAKETARELKIPATDPLSDEEKSLTYEFEGPGGRITIMKLLGKTKQNLDHLAESFVQKSVKNNPVVLGDTKVVAINAAELREAIDDLLGFVRQERRIVGPPGAEVEKTFEHNRNLIDDLKSIKDFIAKGGTNLNSEVYKELLEDFRKKVNKAKLDDNQKEALSWVFPSPGSDSIQIASPYDWKSDITERYRNQAKNIDRLNKYIENESKKPGTENVDDLEKDVNDINQKMILSSKLLQNAEAMSPEIASMANRSFKLHLYSGVTPLPYDEEAKKKIRKTYDSIFGKISKKYGAEQSKKILDYVEQSVLAKHDADSKRNKLYSTNLGRYVLERSTAKKNYDVAKSAYDGMMSMVVEKVDPTGTRTVFVDERFKTIYDSAEKLIEWINKTKQENLEKINFQSVKKLADLLDTVRKRLITLSRTEKAHWLWDYGTASIYRSEDVSKPEDPTIFGTSPSFDDEGESSKKGSHRVGALPKDPEEWPNAIREDKVLLFLRKQADELAKGGKGRPEKVPGPSFSEIGTLIKYVERLLKSIKKYDPESIKENMINGALARADIGSRMRASKTIKEKKLDTKDLNERIKSENIKPLTSVGYQQTQPSQTSAPEKVAGLAYALNVFMSKMAAVRAATPSFFERMAGKVKSRLKKYQRYPVETLRMKKTGPVYLKAFFIDPDGVDEFVHELERSGFDFVDSLAMQAETMTDEQRKKLPSPDRGWGAVQPPRGYKFDLDKVVTKTLLRGSAGIKDHILNNKDRMAAVFGKRLNEAKNKAEKALQEIESFRKQSFRDNFSKRLEFLKELAAFLRDPKPKIMESLQHAYPEKVMRERRKMHMDMDEDINKMIVKYNRYDAFKERRDELWRKYRSLGVDPATKDDYRYADKVVKEVDDWKKDLSINDLLTVKKNFPNYETIKSSVESLENATDEKKIDNRDLALISILDAMNRYLDRRPQFKRLMKMYPPEAMDYEDEETERLYKEEIAKMPEEDRHRILSDYQQRAKELSEVRDWEDFSSWIRNIQKKKVPAVAEGISVELKQAKGLSNLLKKRLADAEKSLSEAKTDEEKSKAAKAVSELKSKIEKAETDVKNLETALARAQTVKGSPEGFRLPEHEPYEWIRLYKAFMEDVEYVLDGKKTKLPRILLELVNEPVVSHTHPDELVRLLQDMERRLSKSDVELAVIPNVAEWPGVKKRIEKELAERRLEAMNKKKLLEEAKKKIKDLPKEPENQVDVPEIGEVPEEERLKKLDEATQTPRMLAEAEIGKLSRDIDNVVENEKTIRKLVDVVDKLFSKKTKEPLPPKIDVRHEIIDKMVGFTPDLETSYYDIKKKMDQEDKKTPLRIKDFMDKYPEPEGGFLRKQDAIEDGVKQIRKLYRKSGERNSDYFEPLINEVYKFSSDAIMFFDDVVSGLFKDSTNVQYNKYIERDESSIKFIRHVYNFYELAIKYASSALNCIEITIKELNKNRGYENYDKHIKSLSEMKSKLERILKKIDNFKWEEGILLQTAPLAKNVLKKASNEDDSKDDPRNIENWLKSAPRKYLEELPKIGVDDWEIIESLYGRRKAEYNDLIRGNQMIDVGSDASKRVEELKADVDRRAKELSRLEALKDLKITIGKQLIKVSDVGDVFNKTLSDYLKDKRKALRGLEYYLDQHRRLTSEIETYKQFIEERKDSPGYEIKETLSQKELQSIVNQFYRGIYWYLMDLWATRSGRESVFGSKESLEFSRLYDAMKTFTGVRSNPSIQKVIIAGKQARSILRDVNRQIAEIEAGFKRFNRNPIDVVNHIRERYGFDKKKFDNFSELLDHAKEFEKTAHDFDRMWDSDSMYKSGVSLYFLYLYKEQLESQLRSRNAMYRLLNETASTEHKISVLESIKKLAEGDASLAKEIDDRIDTYRKDIAKLSENIEDNAKKDAEKVSTEALKVVENSKVLKKIVDVSPQSTKSDEKALSEKKASYRNNPDFDLSVLYGNVLQAKIATMAAMKLGYTLAEKDSHV